MYYCRHLTYADLDRELLIIHEQVCKKLGIPVLGISSGARCVLCNRAVGGTEHSTHVPQNNASKLAEAIDVPMSDSNIKFRYAKELFKNYDNIHRIEITNKHLHFDKGTKEDGFPQDVLVIKWI